MYILLLCAVPASSSSSEAAWGREFSAETDAAHLWRGLCSQEFATETWGKRACILEPAAALPDDFLFATGDFIDIMLEPRASLLVLSSVADGQLYTAQPEERPGSIPHFFRNASLLLPAVEVWNTRVAHWAEAVAQSLGMSVTGAEMQVTPPGVQSRLLRTDHRHFLVFQVFGAQNWRAWSENPSPSPTSVPLNRESAESEFSLFQTLSAGQLLYIPSWAFHQASTIGHEISSLHIAVGLSHEVTSNAAALFHLAAEPDALSYLAAVGWSLQGFREKLHAVVQDSEAGQSLRESLPPGWLHWAASPGNWPCAGHDVGFDFQALRASAKDLLETHFGMLLGSSSVPSLSTESFERVAHALATDAGINSMDSGRAVAASPPAQAMEIPDGLHVAYIGWGLNGFGHGILEVRFSWCHQPRRKGMRVRMPGAVLQMVQALAASTSSALSLSELDPGPDVLPRLLFALELSRLPLDPPIRLVRGHQALSSNKRNPDCDRPLHADKEF